MLAPGRSGEFTTFRWTPGFCRVPDLEVALNDPESYSPNRPVAAPVAEAVDLETLVPPAGVSDFLMNEATRPMPLIAPTRPTSSAPP